ncbi:MAG: thioredoxin domain-containing protein [Nanoarchaeota archaeon]|nr:thioredoxin domain-containing protein [Nanoarchaeota archaeon]
MGMKIKKTHVWQLVSLVLLIALVASIMTGGFGMNKGDTNANGDEDPDPTTATTGTATTKADVLKLSASDVVAGDKNAPVTIIMYTDPSCPFCGGAAGGNMEVVNYLKQRDKTWEPTVPGIMTGYVDTGKVKLVFRYFPGHGSGEDAMKILWCVNEQGSKFWELQDIFFANQNLMEQGDTAGLKKLALNLGVDSAKLDSCLASGKYDSRLTAEYNTGKIAGVGGTPAFFVNDQLVSGAVSFKTIKQVIESELAK